MVALSIAKLRVGAEAYQLSGIAQSLDDYYTGNGESPGQWVGRGASLLGLDGEVAANDLRSVLAGLAPGTGGLTPNGTNPVANLRRVPGFDLTFKVPKSVSVLYAVSDDPRVQGAIIDAGDAAVRSALGWLEREAIRVRRGSNNKPWVQAQEAAGRSGLGIRAELSEGVVAASFRHRTSRAGDPFLHWHVLVANMTQGVDGKWSAFVHPELYRHARAAGEIFQAAVREELARTLGLEWRPGRHVHEVAGIPDSIMRVFSKRRQEIEAFTLATGTPADAAGNQTAALATRKSKSEQETSTGLADRWKAEAREHGWGPEQADDLLGTGRLRATVDYDAGAWRLPETWFDEIGRPQHSERAAKPEEWIGVVLRQDLTNDRSTFTVADAVQAVAYRLGDGATIDTIERVTNRVMASPSVLQLHADGPGKFTSRELHETERRFANSLTALPHGGTAPKSIVDVVLQSRPTIGHDQEKAVRTLTSSQARVVVLVGPAGTGKTFTLDAIRDVFEMNGQTVIGAAPSARAASELAAGAGIESSTMHSLLARIEKQLTLLDESSVLVIDEAGMADIRTLERLTTHAIEQGSRVVLVGDQHQLPEVGAGGGFAYAAKQAGAAIELIENRRQKQPWEQNALGELRNGSVSDAVTSYATHDRLIVTPDSQSMIDRAVTTWFDAQASGLDLVLQAGTNEVAERLNAAVVDRLTASTGALYGAESVDFAGGRFRAGERVVIRRNYNHHADPNVRVRNGQSGTVSAAANGAITIRLDDQATPVTLDRHFVAAGGHLSHGYAHTTHRTQGGTWDASIAVGLDGLYREGAYTALSRGRHTNVIILTDPEARQLEAERDTDPQRHDAGLRLPTEQPAGALDELGSRVAISRAKQFAIDTDPDLAEVDRLARSTPYDELLELAARARQVERLADRHVGATVACLTDQLERHTHTAHHIGPGVQVRPNDRNNIGTVLRVNSQSGTAAVRLVAQDGHSAIKTMAWSRLTVVDAEAIKPPLTAGAQDWLSAQTARVNAAQVEWLRTVAELGSDPTRARLYQRSANAALNQAVALLAAEQPGWLTQLLGQRPASPEGASTWDSGVESLTRHRLRTRISAGTPGLGDRETDPAGFDRVSTHLARARNWLHHHPEHAEPNWPSTPSHDQLIERRREVDAILATAPPSQKKVIDQLLGGQLSFTDTQQLLDSASATQDERGNWILANWPHVVEAAEIETALDTNEAPLNVESPTRAPLSADVHELEL